VLLAACFVLAAVCAGSADGRQAKGPPDKSKIKPVVKPKADAVGVQTFDLVRADPEEVRMTITKVIPPRPGNQGLRLAVDARTKTLFARGTAKELEAVADIVAILDTPAGKPLPEGKGIRVVRLEHVKVNDVVSVLTGLGLQAPVALPKLNALILPEGDEAAKDVRTVVEKLDVKTPLTRTKPVKGR
jgi:hypothetical protein